MPRLELLPDSILAATMHAELQEGRESARQVEEQVYGFSGRTTKFGCRWKTKKMPE